MSALVLTRARASARLLVRPHALVAIVGLALVARLAVAWQVATPLYYPDEYFYSELSRSIAAHGAPMVRGHLVPFPALLGPLLTAPAWLLSSVGASYRLAQAEGTLAMSLAAVPAFVLARRVGVRRREALAVAAATLLVPDLVDGSFMLSEPFAFPLFLGAVAAAVPALARPSRRGQAIFLALALALCLARVQFVIVPVAYAVAVAALRLRGRPLRAHALPLSAFALAVVAAVAAGPERVLGAYADLVHNSGLDVGALAHYGPANVAVLALAAGWVAVPGAVIGLSALLRRARSDEQAAFAALTATLVPLLVLQAAVFGVRFDELMERYCFYAVPLLFVCFAVAAERGLLAGRAHAYACGALAAAGLLSPLSEQLFFANRDHSPVLLAYGLLYDRIDWGAPLVLGGSSALAALVALELGRRGRSAAIAGVAVAVCVAASVGSSGFLVERASSLQAEGSFADRAGVGHLDVVAFHGTDGRDVLETMFWNRTADRVRTYPGAFPDQFGATPIHVAADGRLDLRRPFLVQTDAALVRLSGARLVARTARASVWVPEGRPRLVFLADGAFARIGWLAGSAQLSAWPRRPGGAVRGHVQLRLRADALTSPLSLRLTSSAGWHRLVRLTDKRDVIVSVPISGRGPWSCGFHTVGRQLVVGGRSVGVHLRGLAYDVSSGGQTFAGDAFSRAPGLPITPS